MDLKGSTGRVDGGLLGFPTRVDRHIRKQAQGTDRALKKILEPVGLGASSRTEGHQSSISLAEPERQLLSSRP